jgi:rod shape-determining protein MreC
MENFFTRYKNPLVLMAVLFIQIVALATQVKRPDGNRPGSSGSTRLIRVWTVTAITPFEHVLVSTGHFFRSTWRDYIDLHDVRRQNLELEAQLAQLRLELARQKASADESQRLRALLDFKEHYVGATTAAQVIGTSGTDSLRTITIDKGSHAGIQLDMGVITPDGIVGKVKEVFPLSSVVLLINDRESGAGVILETSRLHGILRGTGPGELTVTGVMSDEKVDVGEAVVTSGGDRVYPKGLPVGTVTHFDNDAGPGPFLAIKIKPTVDLDRLEEVLVVTRIAADAPVVTSDPHRTAEILAQRLPSVTKPAENPAPNASPAAGSTGVVPPAGSKAVANPAVPTATAGNKAVAGQALPNPTPTPVKKKNPSLPPSEGGSQASPSVAPPTDSSQPDSVVRPKPHPSPAANGEKPPR